MITIKKLCICVFFILYALVLHIEATEVSSIKIDPNDQVIVNIREYSNLTMTEFTLKNGMRFILKHTDDDSEICIRLVALGGYAATNPEDRISFELSPNLVMESGIGALSADKLSAFLYDHSLDFNLKVEPFIRSIDASLPEESLEPFFSLVNKTFTAPHFKSDAFDSVLAKKKSELAHKSATSSQYSTHDILSLETIQEKQSLYPLCAKDLEKADFNKARQFFLHAFSNPSEFICVIVGNIDIEKTKKLSAQYFSSIPLKNSEKQFILPSYSAASKVVAIRTQNLPNSKESLVRLALPLQIHLDSTKLEQLELICQVVETRLRTLSKAHLSEIKRIDVGYELPLYPSLEHPWMTIQFHVDNNHTKTTLNWIVEKLRSVCKKGLSSNEIHLAAKIKQQSVQLWEHDNNYWIVLLSNYYLWGWNPLNIAEKFKNPLVINPKEIHSTLRTALLMDEYTFSY